MDWDRAATCYDWQLRFERAAIAAAVALARPERDEEVLDVGTGTGAVLRELARRPDRPRKATGVDASPRMLARIPSLPAGWALETADARLLPFADCTFAVVTAAYLLHVVDVTARREIIGECRRVLRAGGRLITVTPTLPPTPLARLLYASLAKATGSTTGLRPLDPRPALEEASFRIGTTVYVSRGYPSLCVLAIR